MQDKILSTLQRFWRGFLAFTPGQKAVTVAVGLALVVGGFTFSSWASKPSYAPLFTNLAPADASGIIDKLNANKTPYQLAANGTSILVPQKDVYNLRLTMSAAGLPSSGSSGYSLLDQEGITTSEFKQHVDYQRALEGELSKTIKSISGVRDAAVHLAIPQQSVFTDGSQKATGSVLLTTDPGTTLTSGQVQSVVNLVSSSVPGMGPDQVSVSDASGKVLSVAGDANSAAAADTRTEAIAQYNKRVSAEVQQMLDRLVGAGHSVVTVNADLDFDKNNTVTHSYSYATGIPPLSEANTTETYGPGQSGTGGVLGAASPSPSAQPSSSAGGGYRKTTTTRDNAVGESTETRSAAPGKVRTLSVAVLLDKNAPPVDEAQVRQLVGSAVGLDLKRGDSLAVASAPFDTSAADQAKKAADQAAAAAASARRSAELISLAKTVLVVLLVLALIVATMVASRRRRRNGPADELDTFLATLNDAPGSLPPAPRDIVPPHSREAAANLARQRDLAEMADSEPHEVARLLRTWLNTKES
ncbi:flagellar basal-body MS-ring/collar protein FliF [Jatrophihabitans sp.]|uniref:flagellar basal-body MS-ring/collar protein FliF n=1 Tax=Jatrophihabitans sp. TaxID=1932789 RepID=UPI002D035199|nr:flagellar basal-body MS-ring/collar protein FliF [Jatrophihabitans sp.]